MGGTYAVIVGYHDESDGAGSMTLEVGSETLRWTLDHHQISASKRTNENIFVRRVVSQGVELNDGDVVRLTGQRDRGELAAVDYIELRWRRFH